jgi:peptide/nickel transport system substrate-binding protein
MKKFNRAKSELTRRDFLKATSAGTAAGLLARVASQPALAQMTYSEAPALAAMVAAGDLPPVEERLPLNPLVVEPLEGIGQYGGQWAGGTTERNPNFYIRNGGYQQLLRWTPTWDGIIPNIAESVEANDAGTEFTFRLREGIKYSDGVPLTADDIMFWYEDVLMNEELTPAIPSTWSSGGDPVMAEKIDDFTVKFSFTAPSGLFLKFIARTEDERTTAYPRHYMEQFHIKYNENAEQEAVDAGFGSWIDRFETMNEPSTNAEIPTLRPWNFRTSLGDAANNRVILERNPYFWKVDTEGNQLPYMDTQAIELATDPEVLLLKALNGELDYQERFISAPRNKAVLFDNKEQGQFDFYELTPTTVNEFIIQLNLTHPDPVKREIFSNKDFRIGLSHAIDRQLIIDVVHVGQGEPWQASPRPESRFHHERLAKQYTEYNVDLANEHLDNTGWTERDDQGFRIGPDGNRLSFIMELDQARTTYIDAMELIKPNWEAVGVEVIVSTMERSLWEERIRSSNIDFDASGHRFGGGSGDAVILDARYWFPENNGSSIFGKAWAFWYNGVNPEVAEEPPDAIKEAMALYDEIKVTPDDARQFELMMRILDIAADEFYAIGTVLEPNAFGVVTNRMRNVPGTMPNSWIYASPAPYNPEQFWLADA